MHQQTIQSMLSDEDLANTVLADLKRVVREYATAATESTCPDIRDLFTKLTDSTLALQGKLFNVLKQNNMYSTASPALRQEIDKQLKEYMQTKQKTAQFLQTTLQKQTGHTMYTPSSQAAAYQQNNFGQSGSSYFN